MQAAPGARPSPYISVRFRLDDDRGWFVVGPVLLMQLGPVEVFRKDGSAKTVTVRRLGEPFLRHGLEFVPGYLRS